MKRFSLTKSAVKLIHAAVDKLFDRVKARFLGRDIGDKRIYIAVKPRVTLPELYETAAREEGVARPDENVRAGIQRIAEGYIEAQRQVTKTRVEKAVASWLSQAYAQGVDTDVNTVLGGELASVFGKASSDVKRIIDTEASYARNVGTMEGIVRVNASAGIKDPVVYFVVVRDSSLCDECKRLHLLEDGITPRLWYMSEIGHGYHKKGDDSPKLGGLHPHCRCSLVTLMPGYGFEGGRLTFIALDHDEMAVQRGFNKNESPWWVADVESLSKSTRDGLKSVLPTLKDQVQENKEFYRFTGRVREDEIARLPHARITVNFPSEIADKIHESGRWKNLYETGFGMGETDQELRKSWEDVIGIPSDTPPTERPIYGALAWNKEHRHFGAAPAYGDAWVVLKPHKHNHATYTPWDSSLLNKRGGVSNLYEHDYDTLHKLVDHHYRQPTSSYIEAQIHGGIYTKDDLDSVHVIGEQRTKWMDDHRWKQAVESANSRVENVRKLAEFNGLPIYQHFYDPHGSKPVVVNLVYDPRSPELRRHHAEARAKILGDVNNVINRAERELGDEQDDTRRARLNYLVRHGRTVEDEMNAHYNQHTVTGHHHFVKLARELFGADQFHYLDAHGNVHKPSNESVGAPVAEAESLSKSTRDGLKSVLPTLKDQVQENKEFYRFTGRVREDEIARLPHARITVNFPSSLANRIHESGRWKNLYETGSGMGNTDQELRKSWEDVMGIPSDTPPTERPIYGALAWKKEHRYFGAAPTYGDAWVVLKPHKHSHTTYTPWDSSLLDDFGGVRNLYDHDYETLHKLVDHHYRHRVTGYIEAQIHGGIYTKDDLDSVHVLGEQRAKGMDDRAWEREKEYANHRLENVRKLAEFNGLPIYQHLYNRSSVKEPVVVKLVYDPRVPELRRHHAEVRAKILGDVNNVINRAERELGDEQDDTRRGRLDYLVRHGRTVEDEMNAPYNQHTVTGHHHFVKLARELFGADQFHYLDDVNVPDPSPESVETPVKPKRVKPRQLTLPGVILEGQTAGEPGPSSPRPRAKKPRLGDETGGIRTSRKQHLGTSPPEPGIDSGSTTPSTQ
jgi:hypothetical protein